MSSGKGQASPSGGPVVRCGHFRKLGSMISSLKPMSKKYFVLRGDITDNPACLEYYDSKKKFDNRQPPKRSITIRSCYNINRRSDTKHKHVIGLYTKDDCFSLILENDKELEDWLTAMLLLAGDVPDGEQPRPTFEHVWQVTLENERLAKQLSLAGPYRLCLTDRTLSLIKVGADTRSDCLEFPLTTIRRSGYMDRTFYMEVGRATVTGEGDFYMTAEDNNIAHNMDATIKNAMGGVKKKSGNKDKDEVVPQTRKRSSSANEASKPIAFIRRRPTGSSKPHGFSPLEEQSATEDQSGSENITASAPSQSCSQSQSTSGNTLTAGAGTRSLGTYAMSSSTANRRRHSVASQPITTINSQSVNVTTTIPTLSSTISVITTSNNTTTTSTTMIITPKSHQRTLSLPLAAVAINQTQSSKRSVLRCATGRDRCDSLPSRARTASEGQPAPLVVGHPRTAHLVLHPTRPHSMYGRGLSYSPPISSMPISPASGACSTDSAGSSLSMDEGGDNIEESSTKYGSHSLTPDEPVILEENMDDYVPWSNNVQANKYSPNFKSHSPSQQSSYVEMYSPCGSSPGRGGAYMPMSPVTTGLSHSRASSLVEESTLPDGYVPMAPVGDDGYVPMDPSNGHNGHFPDDMSQHGSSCSVTSGTPSTDTRLSDYPLDKVSSFLTPSDDLSLRKTRAYSVGSRDEPSNRHRKNRLDIAVQESSRVRAFSVGSRSKRPELGRLCNIITSRLPTSVENVNPNKSNSAPMLSSSWGHNSVASERMEDLMEMDFSRTNVPTTISSSPSSYSQSQSYSTATDTSSYVDMSPGQPHGSSTAPYVDMSGVNKVNRNNNNNITTTNHNHNVSTPTTVQSVIHKPSLKTLKPVVEAEGPYMRMDNSLDDWRTDISPKQPPSPMQEDYMQMNGPPGVNRTAPVDLPQPRKPPEGYVEMGPFKTRPSLEQDYINMKTGVNRPRHRQRQGNRKDKSRSQPIAIQASKPSKTPCFLPLTHSPSLETLTTPTSSTTIFPFSLNSPQSPVKPFDPPKQISETSSSDCSPDIANYAVMSPLSAISALITIEKDQSKTERPESPIKAPIKILANIIPQNSILNIQNPLQIPPNAPFPTPAPSTLPGNPPDSPLSPLTKRLTDNLTNKKKQSRNTTSPITISLSNSSKDEPSPTAKHKADKPVSPGAREAPNNSPDIISQMPQSPVTKKLAELSVSKSKLVGPSPNTSPTPTGTLKMAPKTISPKIPDDTTPTATPTPTPSPLDSEGYEKLQPGVGLLHYASLDLPESTSVPPVSPTPAQEGFRYAEIDFAKLKQN